MEKTVKKRKCTGGFTLVELIVVIAILGILAGVGTVAYTGYITATRKGVDRTLVGDLIYAAQLADYANPSLLNDSMGIIVVTDSGASASGGNQGDSAFKSAIEDSVGNLSNVSLSYDSWGTKVADVTGMLDTISDSEAPDSLGNYLGKDDAVSGGSVTVGYADVANDYWKVVESAARSASSSSSLEGFTEDMAAQLTVLTAYATTKYSDEEQMGNSWATSAAPESTCLDPLDAETDAGAVAAGHAVSLKGANLARNMAFAQYLKKYGTYDGVEDDVAKLLDSTIMSDQLTTTAPISGEDTAYAAVVNQYLTTEVTNGKSQAYIDGLAYYTFMKSMDSTYGDYVYDDDGKITDVNISDNFWDETDNHISWAAAVGSGKISVDEMKSALNGVASDGNVVIVMADRTKGYLKCTVFPVDADPRDGEEDTMEVETPTETVTMTITEDSITINPTEIKTIFKSGGGLSVTSIRPPEGWTFVKESCNSTCTNDSVFDVSISIGRGGYAIFSVEQNVPTAMSTHELTGTATLSVTIKNSETGDEKPLTTTISLKALN